MTEYDLILKNGHVQIDGLHQCDIGCRDGRIAAIGNISPSMGRTVMDCSNLVILPGLIDPHVHLRDPGNPAVETIHDGTRGAILGGITTVFDMPNTLEPVTSRAVLDRKRDFVADQAWCDIGMYVWGVHDNIPALSHLELQPNVCAIKVFMAGNMMVDDDSGLEALMHSGTRRVCYHSEDNDRLLERRKLFTEGQPHRMHSEWRDVECAFLGTRRLLALARRTGRPTHILHVSTMQEIEYIQSYRDICTAEVLVNHLTQIGPEVYDTHGGYAVMNPPIRGREHYDALWRAINEGHVDCIGSDHAPHARAAKERPWPSTAAGLTGVQTLLPIMLDHVNAGRLSLARMVQLMAHGPARVYGAINKGRIALDYDADFTIVDMKKKRTIEESWITSPCGWTPFHGYSCHGWPHATVIRGRIVMREDQVLGQATGKPVFFH